MPLPELHGECASLAIAVASLDRLQGTELALSIAVSESSKNSELLDDATLDVLLNSTGPNILGYCGRVWCPATA